MKLLSTCFLLFIVFTVNAQSWKSMVGPMQFGLADEQEIAILDNNRPVLAMIETGSSQIVVHLWDGESWQALPQIVPDVVQDVQVSHDGNTPYVGFFNTGVAKYQIYFWNGTSWVIIGDTGVSSYHPGSIHFINSVNSPEVWLSHVNTPSQQALMQKWDGSAWSAFGVGFDPYVNNLQEIIPGSDGGKIWSLHNDSGSGGELRLFESDEGLESWSYYANSPTSNEQVLADLSVIQGNLPFICYNKSSALDVMEATRPDGGGGFNAMTSFSVPGGIDELSSAVDNSDVPFVFIKETASTDGKLIFDDGGTWSAVGGVVHTNANNSRLELFKPSSKAYIAYNIDGEATVKVYNTPPTYTSDAGNNSVCQDATGASVFTDITFDDIDNDSVFISPISTNLSLLLSSNITVTRTNPFNPLTTTNKFSVDVTPESGQSGSVIVNLNVIDGVDTLVYQVTVVINPLPTISAGANQVHCAGVSTAVSGSGGTSYVWDNGVTDGVSFSPLVGTTIYNVIGTDINGCSSTDNLTMIVYPTPTFALSNTNVACNGLNDGTITLSGLNSSQNYDVTYDFGSTVGPNTLASDGSGNIVLTGLAAGTYTNFNLVDLNGCIGVNAGPLTITQPAVLSSIPISDQFICDGTSATLNGAAIGGTTLYNYSWDNGVTDGLAFTPSVGSITYNLTITDANGCITTDNTNITVYALPTIGAGANQVHCDGVSTTVNGTGGTFYVWDNGVTDGVSFSPLVGTTIYNVIGTDVNGCSNTDNLTMIVYPTPTFALSNTNVACNGLNDGTITLSGLNVSQNYDVTYDFGSTVGPNTLTSDGAGNIILTGLAAGTYTNFNLVDLNGCIGVNAGPLTITQPAVLSSISIADQFICDGTSTTLNGAAIGGTTLYNYSWDNGVTDGLAFTPSVGSITYNLTITDANGCITTDNTNITVYALPTIGAGANQVLCDGASTTVNGTGGTSYVWDNGVTDGVSFNPLVGITTYTVIGTDANGCSSTDALNITTYPNPPAITVTTANPTLCGASDGSFQINGLLASTLYDISYSDPSPQGPFSLTSNGAGAITVSSLNAGSYSSITATNTNGCSTVSSGPFNLVDPSAPSINAGVDQSICAGEGVLLTAINTDNALIQWSDFAIDGQMIAPSTTTTYTVTATSSGCTSTDQITITVYPIPNISIAVTDETCGAGNGAATATIISGLAPYIIYWSNGETTQSVSNLNATFYYINVTDANNCYAMDVATVGSTVLSISGIATDNLCDGDQSGSVDLTVSGTGPLTYAWSNGAITEDISNLANGQYEVLVTDANGCNATASFAINSPQPIHANYTTTSASCGSSDGTISTFVQGGTTPYIFQWYNSIGTAISGQTNTNLGTASAGYYTLQITDVNGCMGTISTVLSESTGPVVSIDSLGASSCLDDGFINVDVNSAVAIVSTLWNSGQTSEDLINVGSAEYVLTVEDNNGCKGLVLATIPSILPVLTPICIVTVDTSTNTNLIVWEKPLTNEIDHFKIYRESSIAGSYQLVDTVHYSSLSEYNDTIAYPSLRSWRYVLTTVDTCGNESLPSDDHKTIHITRTTDGLGNYSLYWDAYEGFSYTNFHVWRFTDQNGWEEIAIIPFASTATLADTPPFENGLDYMIIVDPPSTCTSTSLKATDYNSSRSNRTTSSSANPGGNGGASISANGLEVQIYPNPSNGQFIVHVDGVDSYKLDVYDISGKLIKSEFISATSFTLDMSMFEAGSYLLKIETPFGSTNQQILKL